MKRIILPLIMLGSLLTSCNNDSKDEAETTSVVLKDQSVTPSLIKAQTGFESLKIYSLFSSDDVFADSPKFVFGGSADGSGLLKNTDGTFTFLVNNEDNFAVSRITLDKTFKPVKGDYIVDGVGGLTRLCSATLATPEIHGFGPIFLTAGESGQESMVHGIDPLGQSSDKSRKDRVLPALGKASMENAVPLPKEAYPGKTVILIGEDQSYATSHVSAGQLILYVSSVGDLSNGKLYALKRTDGNQVETDIKLGSSYPVQFVEIPNAKNLTGAVINTTVNDLKAIRFSRVEDVDYRKGSASNNREVYFTATGQATNNVPVEGYTMWGRVYKVKLDATNPLKGTLELAVEGDSTPGTGIINPDNLCVTENYVYIQEDGDSFYADNKHDGRVWQYNIATKALKPMIEMNHRRTDATFNAKYNPISVNTLSSWEYGAMYDISDLVGIPGTFLLNVHPHTWRDMKYSNADGSNTTVAKSITDSSTGSYAEGGQVVILSGVPR